jgi:hypothetical protein
MREKLLWFIAKFLIVSFALFLLWQWKIENLYILFLNGVIYHILIFLTFKIRYYYSPTEFFYSLIPFVSLMIITREVELKKRLLYLVLGFLIIMAWHIISYEIVFELYDRYLHRRRLLDFAIKPFYLLSGALPFILWLILLRKTLWKLFSTQKADKSQVSH